MTWDFDIMLNHYLSKRLKSIKGHLIYTVTISLNKNNIKKI
jgi:hypothetical protein